MCYIPDYFDQWSEYNRQQEEELKKLPICERCGEPIQQEKAVYYNDQWICEECESEFWLDIRDDFMERTEDYVS